MISPLEFLKELLNSETDIFADNEQEKLQNVMAILITHVILADGKVTSEERAKVLSFFENEFELESAQTEELFASIMDNINEFEENLDTLQNAIKNNSLAKSELLRHINNIIICDGCVDREYDVFESIRLALA